MPRVLLAGSLDADAEARLTAAAEVIRAPRDDEETLCALLGDCDALVVRTNTAVTRRVLAAGRRLRAVGVAGVGVDRVDVAAAAELGIAVLNTPGAATESVADLALALMLQLLRPIPWLTGEIGADGSRRRGPGRTGRSCELTVGIIGMGRIGTAVARRCVAGCGARVLYNDIVPVGPFDFAGKIVPGPYLRAADKDEIWRTCDVISLHVPLTEPGSGIAAGAHTRGLVDAAVLGRVKPGAYLINTARGGVVDTATLTAALTAPDGERRLAGAALDVTEPEPLPPDHPLFACPRCILTPHIAARTYGGLRRMYAVVDAVLAFLDG